MRKTFTLFTLFLSTITLNAQVKDDLKDKIIKTFQDYFYLERENIHLQFNKKIFFTNENIWFKGYVYNRNTNLPSIATTNVYASLYNPEGEKLKTQLLYSANGSFQGNFKLESNFKTGKYYVQTYTNWMNNFSENESSIFEINVINENEEEAKIAKKTFNLANTTIELIPEGGNLVEGTINNIGIKITNIDNKNELVKEVDLVDFTGNSVKKISINKLGYGKFQLSTKNNIAKVNLTINGKTIQKNIPPFSKNGIALDINNYTVKDKTIATFRVNPENIDAFAQKKLYLVIQQDNKSAIIDLSFNNKNHTQTLLIDNNNLYEGVSILRVIDEGLNQLATRHVFKYPKTEQKIETKENRKLKDSISIKANSTSSLKNLSLVALTQETVAIDEENTIYNSFLIKPYLSENLPNSRYYFTEISNLKHKDLDLFFLNQTLEKYKWSSIISNPPQKKYDFEQGITLKGNLNQEISDKNSYQVEMYSLLSKLNEKAKINEKNEFYFNNLVLADSTGINFSLIKLPNKRQKIKPYIQILNNNSIFKFPFKVKDQDNSFETFETISYDLPKFDSSVIMLESVEIKKEQKEKLTFSNSHGNGNLRGIKLSEEKTLKNLSLINILMMNGFKIYYNDDRTLTIYTKEATPEVPIALFINNLQLFNFSELETLIGDDVDEFYYSLNSKLFDNKERTIGILKVYLKPYNTRVSTYSNISSGFDIKNGFSKNYPFKNSKYLSTDNKGFQNFGVVNWVPSINTQKNGEFKFSLPDMNQKKVKILIEGISEDGKLVSELKTIDLE